MINIVIQLRWCDGLPNQDRAAGPAYNCNKSVLV